MFENSEIHDACLFYYIQKRNKLLKLSEWNPRHLTVLRNKTKGPSQKWYVLHLEVSESLSVNGKMRSHLGKTWKAWDDLYFCLSECIFRLLSLDNSFVIHSLSIYQVFMGLDILTVWLSSMIGQLDKARIRRALNSPIVSSL